MLRPLEVEEIEIIQNKETYNKLWIKKQNHWILGLCPKKLH